MPAQLTEQEIINRNNIVALNQAFKDLRTRVDELENSVRGLQRTIAVKEQEIMTLKQQLIVMTHSGLGGSATSK